MSAPSENRPTVVTRQPNFHALGFFVACSISLFLSALALGAVICWADWFGRLDGDRIPELQTIVVLGNVGGAAGSVKGNPDGTNEPPPLPPDTKPETIRPVPTPPPPKPVMTVDDVKRTVTEAQQWLSRTTPQLPTFAMPEITLQIPPVPTDFAADAWKRAANWTAEQLPKLKSPELKQVPQEQPKKEEPKKEKPKKQEPRPTAPEKKVEEPKPAPKQPPHQLEERKNPAPRGNAEYNGNNRSGSGNAGSGGNNDGADLAARLHESNVAPPYPFEADRLNIEGTVKLLIDYDATGRITRVTIHASSGNSLLDDPVLDYVQRNWIRIHPRQAHGRPASGSLIVPLIYRKK